MFDKNLLNDKVALVTGASRGIGRGIALALAEAGADVIVHYARKASMARGVVAEIQSMGKRAIAIKANFTENEKIDAMLDQVQEEFGGCDIFVANAATGGFRPMLESSDKHDHTNLTWHQKKRYLANVPICFIAPTSWGVDRIRASSLFRDNRTELIPYPINTSIFRPIDQWIARDLLHLPLDKKVIFVGATYLEERRKGMAELLALEHLNLLLGNCDASIGRKASQFSEPGTVVLHDARPTSSHHPHFRPLFCSWSHAINGWKYAIIAEPSILRLPVKASSASGHGRDCPICSIALRRRPASWLP